jgi:hypothetical protein
MQIISLIAAASISIFASSYQIAPPASSYESALCNVAEVYNLKHRAHLAVRREPGEKYSIIDTLNNGKMVYTCNESGEWLFIYYEAVNRPCKSRLPAGLDARNATTCKSGWVKRKWVNVLSG